MQGQCCDDAGDTALIKNKGVGPKWVETSIRSDLPDGFSSIIMETALTLELGVNGLNWGLVAEHGEKW